MIFGNAHFDKFYTNILYFQANVNPVLKVSSNQKLVPKITVDSNLGN